MLAFNRTIDTCVHDPIRHGSLGLVREYTYLASFLGLLLTVYLIANHFSPTVSPEEPSLVPHRIPFVGHLLGIIIHGIKYFDDVGRQTNKPIFTVPILNGKAYVITSPDLVTACMRETRTLSFNPFIVEVFRRMAGLTGADMEITKTNMDDKSQPGYMTDMHRVQYASLAIGPALDKMNSIALSNISTLLSQTLPSDPATSIEIPLFATIQHIASISSLRATYGPSNPFDKDPNLLQDFWNFEFDLKYILLDLFPSITVRRAHAARARLTAAFVKYYESDAYRAAAGVIQDRYVVARKWDQKITTIAAFDVGLCFGILANAVPSVFWMLVYIFRDPALLSAVREEIALLSSGSDKPDSVEGKMELKLDLKGDKYLRQNCPLLTSVFHEMLRVVSSPLSSGRFVLQDTILTESGGGDGERGTGRSYLLKKGNTVQIPSHSLHHPPSSSSIKSPFAIETATPHDEFDPRRFLDFGAKIGSEPERTLNGSFRAFGGGSSLCPGRKFAFVKVVGFVAAFVSLWEIEGLVGMPVPEMDLGRVAVAVAKPKRDVVVKVKRRIGFEEMDVRVNFSSVTN